VRQIYHASEAYGIEDIRTSGGYFHLGKVFHELSRDDIAESMFDRVIITSRSVNSVICIFLSACLSVCLSVCLSHCLHFHGHFCRWYQNVSILDFIGAKDDGGGEW